MGRTIHVFCTNRISGQSPSDQECWIVCVAVSVGVETMEPNPMVHYLQPSRQSRPLADGDSPGDRRSSWNSRVCLSGLVAVMLLALVSCDDSLGSSVFDSSMGGSSPSDVNITITGSTTVTLSSTESVVTTDTVVNTNGNVIHSAAWTIVSGGVGPIIANPDRPRTQITITDPGEWVLRLTIDYSLHSGVERETSYEVRYIKTASG